MAITPAFQADNAGSIPAARSKFYIFKINLLWLIFCLPSKAGKSDRLKEVCITLTKGKRIRMARALLANDKV